MICEDYQSISSGIFNYYFPYLSHYIPPGRGRWVIFILNPFAVPLGVNFVGTGSVRKAPDSRTNLKNLDSHNRATSDAYTNAMIENYIQLKF